jgi:hypothetical protein
VYTHHDLLVKARRPMTAGLANLKHIVVLMMQGRSFDHMLGDLAAENPRINGLTGDESNLDPTNEPAKVQPKARFQGQLDPAPSDQFWAVHKQLFEGTPGPPQFPPWQALFGATSINDGISINAARSCIIFRPISSPYFTLLHAITLSSTVGSRQYRGRLLAITYLRTTVPLSDKLARTCILSGLRLRVFTSACCRPVAPRGSTNMTRCARL